MSPVLALHTVGVPATWGTSPPRDHGLHPLGPGALRWPFLAATVAPGFDEPPQQTCRGFPDAIRSLEAEYAGMRKHVLLFSAAVASVVVLGVVSGRGTHTRAPDSQSVPTNALPPLPPPSHGNPPPIKGETDPSAIAADLGEWDIHGQEEQDIAVAAFCRIATQRITGNQYDWRRSLQRAAQGVALDLATTEIEDPSTSPIPATSTRMWTNLPPRSRSSRTATAPYKRRTTTPPRASSSEPTEDLVGPPLARRPAQRD